MPAISGQGHVPLLQAREWQNTVGQSGMTPTAFSFLIPVFVVAVVAPFLCVFCIRKRRRPIPVTTTRATQKVKKPPLRRAEAREKLKEITQVSSQVSSETQENQETPEVESRSVLERECAICLSTLHVPSPPEPAILSPTSSLSDEDAATLPPSLPATSEPQAQSTTNSTAVANTTQLDTETILKLSVCGHEFHSECLVSWFVLRKTSCPICRSMYMSVEDMAKYDEEEQLALGGDPATITASAAVADPETQQAAVTVRNWRYFLHGRDAYRREQERQARRQTQGQAQTAVELQERSAATDSAQPDAIGAEAGQEQQQQPEPSRWRRFFSRS